MAEDCTNGTFNQNCLETAGQFPIDWDVQTLLESDEWLEEPIIYGFRMWHILFLSFGSVLGVVILTCCCIKFRIPRTKQEIEADYMRRKILKKFSKRLKAIENQELDEMDLKRALDKIRSDMKSDTESLAASDVNYSIGSGAAGAANASYRRASQIHVDLSLEDLRAETQGFRSRFVFALSKMFGLAKVRGKTQPINKDHIMEEAYASENAPKKLGKGLFSVEDETINGNAKSEKQIKTGGNKKNGKSDKPKQEKCLKSVDKSSSVETEARKTSKQQPQQAGDSDNAGNKKAKNTKGDSEGKEKNEGKAKLKDKKKSKEAEKGANSKFNEPTGSGSDDKKCGEPQKKEKEDSGIKKEDHTIDQEASKGKVSSKKFFEKKKEVKHLFKKTDKDPKSNKKTEAESKKDAEQIDDKQKLNTDDEHSDSRKDEENFHSNKHHEKGKESLKKILDHGHSDVKKQERTEMTEAKRNLKDNQSGSSKEKEVTHPSKNADHERQVEGTKQHVHSQTGFKSREEKSVQESKKEEEEQKKQTKKLQEEKKKETKKQEQEQKKEAKKQEEEHKKEAKKQEEERKKEAKKLQEEQKKEAKRQEEERKRKAKEEDQERKKLQKEENERKKAQKKELERKKAEKKGEKKDKT